MKKKFWKHLAAAALAAAMTLGGAITALAGTWHFDGPEKWQKWYEHDDGSYTVSGWEQIDGSWYHFDSNGYLDIGWIHDQEYQGWYYFDETDGENLGKMVTGKTWDFGYCGDDGKIVAYWPSKRYDLNNGELRLYSDTSNYDNWVTHSAPPAWYTEAFMKITNYMPERDTSGYPAGMALSFDPVSVSPYELDVQLPENWREICPDPFVDTLVVGALSDLYGGFGDIDCSYVWTMKDNGVCHIVVTCTWSEDFY